MNSDIRDLIYRLLLAIYELQQEWESFFAPADPQERVNLAVAGISVFNRELRAVETAAAALWLKRIYFPSVQCPTLRSMAEDGDRAIFSGSEWIKPLTMELAEMLRAAGLPMPERAREEITNAPPTSAGMTLADPCNRAEMRRVYQDEKAVERVYRKLIDHKMGTAIPTKRGHKIENTYSFPAATVRRYMADDADSHQK